MGIAHSPFAITATDSADQPPRTAELEALYRKFESELLVPLWTEIDFDDLPADLTAALIWDAVTKQTAHGDAAALAAWLTARAVTATAHGKWL